MQVTERGRGAKTTMMLMMIMMLICKWQKVRRIKLPSTPLICRLNIECPNKLGGRSELGATNARGGRRAIQAAGWWVGRTRWLTTRSPRSRLR
jgi:hypothetical protein